MSVSDNNAIMGLPIEIGQEVPDVDFPVRVVSIVPKNLQEKE